jgi:predicted transcriptional regulator
MLAVVGVTVVGPRANPDRRRIVLGDSAPDCRRKAAACCPIRWRCRGNPGKITPPVTGSEACLCCSTTDAPLSWYLENSFRNEFSNARLAQVTGQPTAGTRAAGAGPRPHRTLADAPSLRALTHPTRLALMEAIALAGTLTATEASVQVGESPSACAYHLRTLARLGFLEEAGGGRGRMRPWRLAQEGMSVDHSDDPEVATAADALETMLAERLFARIRASRLARASASADVRAVSGMVQSTVFATAAELQQLRTELVALTARYADRIDPARRPSDAVPFELVTFIHEFSVAPTTGAAGAQAHPDS